MRVGLLGDTHGNHAWIKFAVREFHALGITTVIQVGDLGVSRGVRESRRWDRTDRYLRTYGITMLVAPGNHEDYDLIDSLSVGDDGWLHFRPNILLAPRGLRTTMGGHSFVWLGGAGSVDRTLRLEWENNAEAPRYWWPQEAITDADVARTVAGGHADVMVGHEAPARVQAIRLRLRGNTGGFRRDDIEYADRVRDKYMEAFMQVEPALALHGHYHCPGNEDVDFGAFVTHVFGLACDGAPYGIGELELDNLTPAFITEPR
jgi:hypothetical protein